MTTSLKGTWAGAEPDAEDKMGGIKVQLGHVEGEVLLYLHPPRHGLRSTPPPAQDGVIHVHRHLDVRLSCERMDFGMAGREEKLGNMTDVLWAGYVKCALITQRGNELWTRLTK